MVPFDDTLPFVTSGMRIGVAAITTRGLKEEDMPRIAGLIDKMLEGKDNENLILETKNEVNTWMNSFPLYAVTTEVS